MRACDTCGNVYDEPLEVLIGDHRYTFESLECASHLLMFSDMSPETKADVASVAHEVAYPHGSKIVPLLKPPKEILLLLKGLAKMSGFAVNGVERIIHVYRPGEIIGSGILRMASPESPYEVSAMGAVMALAISRSDFLALGRSHPDVLIAMAAEFSCRLDLMTRRVLAALSVEAPVRLSQLLLDFAAPSDVGEFVPLIYPLTHETMAKIIGASRPHTSTVLRDLERAGAVKRRSRRALLVHTERLRDLVERERYASRASGAACERFATVA